ncbi:Putative ribonuclease H protein At1g65750 [Linum perenne]
MFLWLATHERLLTNAERNRRHLCQSAACSRCGCSSESVIHILRDCPIARQTWSLLGIHQNSTNWQDPPGNWIVSGLCHDSNLLFGIAAWMLWKSRNESVFSDASATPIQIASRVKTWARLTGEALEKDCNYSGRPRARRWEQQSKAAAGGIIRDHNGRGLVAFTMNLGRCTVTRAELRGAITGLELAWAYGFRKIALQLDSRAAVAILSQGEAPTHQLATEVLAFRELRSRDWQVEIRHVYREANKAADFLASQGHMFPFGIHIFPLSDCNLGHILRYDCLGVSEPRFILIEN